jgi:hypothetical protein
VAAEKDVVLIYFEDQPLAFARIEEILADSKPNWYHVRLLLLQIPLQTVTWILRDVYIDGEEFTMNGKRMRLEPVQAPEPPETEETRRDSEPPVKRPGDAGSKVISLKDLKKK